MIKEIKGKVFLFECEICTKKIRDISQARLEQNVKRHMEKHQKHKLGKRIR